MNESWNSALSLSSVVLGDSPVTLEQLVAVARHGATVALAESYKERVRRCRAHVDRFASDGKAIYGITTGLGENWNRFIPQEERDIIQRNHTLSHACSVGEPLEEECVRAMLFVMLQHFGSGHTGISLSPLELIRDMLNRRITPLVPAHGTVGYICHEGHIGCALIGEGKVTFQGEVCNACDALEAQGLKPVTLSSKEGLTIVSGTTTVTAFAALGLYDALVCARTSDVIAAMSLEVLKGQLMAFDERVHRVRPHAHQGSTAANVRALLQGSEIEEAYRGHRVQDALSLRCIPQLHGAAKKVLADMLESVQIELNSSVDNPLIFENDHAAEALMACNADGSYLGIASDAAVIAITGLAKMSERRLDRMVNHHVSELPSFLNARPGFNNGLMIPQYAASGLLGEMKLLSHPATVDNGFTCANQEDYTSMGGNAAIKFYRAAKLLGYILAIELLNACQAQQFYTEHVPARATKAVCDRVRKEVPFLENDAMMQPYMEALAAMIRDESVLEAAWSCTGELPL